MMKHKLLRLGKRKLKIKYTTSAVTFNERWSKQKPGLAALRRNLGMKLDYFASSSATFEEDSSIDKVLASLFLMSPS